MSSTRSLSVGFVIFPGFQSLDLSGPLEVFHSANRVLQRRGIAGRGYRLRVLAEATTPVASASGLRVLPDGTLRAARRMDTLVVVGGEGSADPQLHQRLSRPVARLGAQARRCTSVCTGAFLLASAGLLDGRRVTTHWRWAGELQARFPALRVEPDRIFVRDGALVTSAGVTAGIDLALALVEEDLGREIALLVARLLVVYLRRPGGQSQFSVPLRSQLEGEGAFDALLRWMSAHPAEDLSVPALARRAHMSERNFARVFRRELGLTPHRFVLRLRIETARRLLEDQPGAGLAQVASAAGFGSAESLRREFHRALGIPPGDYRARFTAPLES